MTLARRAEINSQHEPEHDVWSDAWGDRALQALGRRLINYGLSFENAALIVEQTWLFYSYFALPTLREHVAMGIAAKQAADRPSISFRLPLRLEESSQEHDLYVEKFRSLQETFDQAFAAPLASLVEMNLAAIMVSQGWLWFGKPRRLEDLEFAFLVDSAAQGLDYVGVFVDDLEAELRTLMDPEVVPVWLSTPNVFFGGRRPANFLDDPLDRQLCDVIARAKFDIPAA